jgi:hypothetical protein
MKHKHKVERWIATVALRKEIQQLNVNTILYELQETEFARATVVQEAGLHEACCQFTNYETGYCTKT